MGKFWVLGGAGRVLANVRDGRVLANAKSTAHFGYYYAAGNSARDQRGAPAAGARIPIVSSRYGNARGAGR